MFSFLRKVSLILYLSTVIGHIHHFSSPSKSNAIVTSLGAFFPALRFLIGRTILTCPIKVRYSLLFLISPVPRLVQASAFL